MTPIKVTPVGLVLCAAAMTGLGVAVLVMLMY